MKILALSGKKSAGKNTCANFILGSTMIDVEMVDWFKINELGQIIVPALVDDRVVEAVFDPNRRDRDFVNYISQNLWPYAKLYSFADPLKEFCMSAFGLTEQQCYGADADKNSLSKLQWKDMPGFDTHNNPSYDANKQGLMTAREVLQYFGTEIVRKMNFDAWAEACIKKIQYEQSDFALITDCRFPNEVRSVQEAGGKVIRLTRSPFNDNHMSETALDNYVGFDHIIDNKNLNIEQTNKALYEVLRKWDWIRQIDDSSVS